MSPTTMPIPYTLAKTALNRRGFIKIDVPLTNSPEMTWYVKSPFAVGIKTILYPTGLVSAANVVSSGYRTSLSEFCYFEFLYGNLLYGKSSVLGIEIIKKISTIESLDTKATTYGLTAVLNFIKALPDDLVLCLDIKWATPLIDAYFKNEKTHFKNEDKGSIILQPSNGELEYISAEKNQLWRKQEEVV